MMHNCVYSIHCGRSEKVVLYSVGVFTPLSELTSLPSPRLAVLRLSQVDGIG